MIPQEPRPDGLARTAAGAPPEPLHADAEALGIVKYSRDDEGHGAVESGATAPWDIWCHFSAVEMDGFKTLVPGERVLVRYYRADQGRFRYVAGWVRPAGSGVGETEPLVDGGSPGAPSG